MNKSHFLLFLLLSSCGVTNSIDDMKGSVDGMQNSVDSMDKKMDTTNTDLAQTNKHLQDTTDQVSEMNQHLDNIEKGAGQNSKDSKDLQATLDKGFKDLKKPSSDQDLKNSLDNVNSKLDQTNAALKDMDTQNSDPKGTDTASVALKKIDKSIQTAQDTASQAQRADLSLRISERATQREVILTQLMSATDQKDKMKLGVDYLRSFEIQLVANPDIELINANLNEFLAEIEPYVSQTQDTVSKEGQNTGTSLMTISGLLHFKLHSKESTHSMLDLLESALTAPQNSSVQINIQDRDTAIFVLQLRYKALCLYALSQLPLKAASIVPTWLGGSEEQDVTFNITDQKLQSLVEKWQMAKAMDTFLKQLTGQSPIFRPEVQKSYQLLNFDSVSAQDAKRSSVQEAIKWIKSFQ